MKVIAILTVAVLTLVASCANGHSAGGGKPDPQAVLHAATWEPLEVYPLGEIAECWNDGFEIARRDLEIRGPGEFLGARQSGAALLRFADLTLDEPLVHVARRAAAQLLATQPGIAQQHVARWLGSKAEFLKA